MLDARDVQLHHVRERELGEPALRRHIVIMRLEPDVRQIEEETGTGRLEEAVQPNRLRHLARLDVEESGDVLHDERLVEARLERAGIADEVVEELFRVERREKGGQDLGAVPGGEARATAPAPR